MVKDSHKFVIILTYKGGSIHLGFDSLAQCVSLMEGQIEEKDPMRMFNYVQDALNEEAIVEGVTYNILDIDSYSDIYGEDSDEDDVE